MRASVIRLLIFFQLLPFVMAAGPGDSLFESAFVHDIRIEFSQVYWWDSLVANYNLTQQTNVDYYIPATVTIDGDTIDSVGVRHKGNASYQHPGTKKPMKLSFNEYISGQEYDGLRSVHLNNSAYDPTMLREKLMLDVLQRQGLPAPRCTFAAVYINNAYVGLYKLIEPVDKQFLQQHFGDDKGNLFKGDPAGSLSWIDNQQSSYYPYYELKTNETENDWSDLLDLIYRINFSGNDLPQQLDPEFDTEAYLRTLAVNNLFVNLDSYLFNPHNYYLYHDSTSADRFHWISWDVGLGFGVFPLWWGSRAKDLDIFYLPDQPDNVPLNKHLYEFGQYRQQYLDAYCRLLNEDFNPNIIFPRIDSLAAVIRPYVYAEPESNRMYSTAQFEGNLGYSSYSAWILSDIPGLKQFIGQRRSEVSRQLCSMGQSCAHGTITAYSAPGIRVYPVPTHEKITVFFEAPDEYVAVYYRLTDMLGNTIFEENVQLEQGYYQREIDLHNCAQGMYLLRVIGSCEDVEQKILIIR